MKKESLKNYIEEQIAEKGFDENGDIKIDFAGLCEAEDVAEVAEEMGYDAVSAEDQHGQGVWWISK